jgi:hypothetical protein
MLKKSCLFIIMPVVSLLYGKVCSCLQVSQPTINFVFFLLTGPNQEKMGKPKARTELFRWRKDVATPKSDNMLQDESTCLCFEEENKLALFEAAKALSASGILGKIIPNHTISNIPLSSAEEFAIFLENLPASSAYLRLRAHLFQPRASPGANNIGNRSFQSLIIFWLSQNWTVCSLILKMTAMTWTR